MTKTVNELMQTVIVASAAIINTPAPPFVGMWFDSFYTIGITFFRLRGATAY
ncbi:MULTISPECIES: hypothetical protein [Lacticaseibacillus]|uniref:Uncharacterized protein n=3 Tax=Lacticaseibacillus TaxID=2759736 RepID=A0ABZ0BY31_LACCA|nr:MULTISPECIES: hypothetical protein [Lacticaseibacillus]MBI6597755.1 hypothetical protein [Lacticaseibacillus casei]MBO1481434.1 hypothetical protein [Lacticaseibacillus casei]MBO2416714.1 hypothetical protein [Lacticaseibacillus casei]MCK2081151.1 hypothetical protein [Lacticaseibacillus casei]MDE3281559.1 hypothetical protein [Lacticaseibacillus casei]